MTASWTPHNGMTVRSSELPQPWHNALARGRASAMGYPEYDQPGRFIPADPEADAAFLAQVRARAEQQRKQGEAERRRRDNGT